jgi:CBS domain-containing protein
MRDSQRRLPVVNRNRGLVGAVLLADAVGANPLGRDDGF